MNEAPPTMPLPRTAAIRPPASEAPATATARETQNITTEQATAANEAEIKAEAQAKLAQQVKDLGKIAGNNPNLSAKILAGLASGETVQAILEEAQKSVAQENVLEKQKRISAQLKEAQRREVGWKETLAKMEKGTSTEQAFAMDIRLGEWKQEEPQLNQQLELKQALLGLGNLSPEETTQLNQEIQSLTDSLESKKVQMARLQTKRTEIKMSDGSEMPNQLAVLAAEIFGNDSAKINQAIVDNPYALLTGKLDQYMNLASNDPQKAQFVSALVSKGIIPSGEAQKLTEALNLDPSQKENRIKTGAKMAALLTLISAYLAMKAAAGGNKQGH